MSTPRNQRRRLQIERGLSQRVSLKWRRRFVVVGGGAAGSLARETVTDAISPIRGWPAGTLLVNMAGSFALGWLLVRLAGGAQRLTLTVPLVAVGLLGGFTTFGAFALELWMLGAGGQWVAAVAYGVVSVVLGLACALFGARFGERT
jgi:CrcB protein